MNRLAFAVLVLASLTALPASAQEGRNASVYNLGVERLAVHGYDPVAYFDEGGARPAAGDPQFTTEHEGVVYRFANAANKALFEADPQLFEPAYGGWCAYAMARDARVDVDPKAFRVSEGRLFLFVDADYTEVDGDWVPEEHELIAAADGHWQAHSGEAPRQAAPGTWRWVNDWNLTEDGLALEGYDPVSYFPAGGGEPAEGSSRHALRHEGVLYWFVSQANLETFRKDPSRYEPQHGGWCSYAMGATGELVEVDPEAFRLTDGQLHLFYNSWLTDTRDDWDEDTAGLKRQADANWASHVEQATPRS